MEQSQIKKTMIRIIVFLVFLLVVFAVYKAIMSFVNVAKVKEFFGSDQKKTMAEVEARAKKNKEKVLRKEVDFIITQGNGYFVLWMEDSTWGIREFNIIPCGNWDKTFKMAHSGNVTIEVDKGSLTLEMRGGALTFPME